MRIGAQVQALPRQADLNFPSPEPLTAAHFSAVLALTRAFEAETGRLDRDRLARWTDAAFLALAVNGGQDGFVIALDQDCTVYDSPNFHWFRARLTNFVYIDRIIVAPRFQGHGLAQALYGAVLARMERTGHSLLACEVNLVPPNARSHAFHGRMGFAQLGEGHPYGDSRKVAYLIRRAGSPADPGAPTPRLQASEQ